MLKSCGVGRWWWVVACSILVSAPVPFGFRVLRFWGWALGVLGLRALGQGLTINRTRPEMTNKSYGSPPTLLI